MAKTNTNVPALWKDLVTDVRTNAEGPSYALGQYREENGRGYIYVRYDTGSGAVAAVANQICFHLGTTDDTLETELNTYFEVTSDVSDSHRNKVAGVLKAVIADEGYGWIQVAGPCTVVTNGDDDIALGQAIISGNTDGTVDSVAVGTAPTHQVVGWALTVDVDAANTIAVKLALK